MGIQIGRPADHFRIEGKPMWAGKLQSSMWYAREHLTVTKLVGCNASVQSEVPSMCLPEVVLTAEWFLGRLGAGGGRTVPVG